MIINRFTKLKKRFWFQNGNNVIPGKVRKYNKENILFDSRLETQLVEQGVDGSKKC